MLIVNFQNNFFNQLQMSTRLRNRKNYHQWVLDHKDEILALPNKQRTDWVLTKINDELNLEMKRYNVYQLLYRNGLIKHKSDTTEVEPTTETTTDEVETTVNAEETADAISGGPVDEQYLHQRIYEMFGVYCPLEEEDPFGYGE